MRPIALISACALMLIGCKGQPHRPVPRQEAFHRVAAYGEDYVIPDGLPLKFAVNAQATHTVEQQPEGITWLTIAYPAYGAHAYCTFTPLKPNTRKKTIANRLERIMLNLGDAHADKEEFETAGGCIATMLTTAHAPMAPVQFLCVSPRWAVSGNAVIGSASPDTPADSLAPIVKIIARDIRHALMAL